MEPVIAAASPIEIASLWHLNFLSGDDVGRVCMRWLEEGLDHGDHEVAALAGETGIAVSDVAPAFERALTRVVGRPVGQDEAILRALHLHLAVALDGDLMEGVQQVISRFQGLSDRRLVHNPRRSEDRPDEVFAEQELGLEYIYGGFYAFDDVQHLSGKKREVAEAELYRELRNAVRELKEHLTATLGG
jgi:hypothetical protein